MPAGEGALLLVDICPWALHAVQGQFYKLQAIDGLADNVRYFSHIEKMEVARQVG